MNYQDRIQTIIAKRKPFAGRVQTVEEELEACQEQAKTLRCNADELGKEIPESASQLQDIAEQCSRFASDANKQTRELVDLRQRLARPTLNIGVIGRARQGKSQLLQALTGLGTEQIPSGNRTDCTGVSSVIRNHPSDIEGTVTFYSTNDFLEKILAPYYRELELGSRPISLERFANESMPALPTEKQKTSDADANSKYEYLKRYHDNFNHYKDFLGAPPKQINKNEIREFVAQNSADGTQNYFNFLAVKKVEVRCRFQAGNIGDICFIDTPGLGETNIGNDERLLKTLAEDVDLLWMVRRPEAAGDSWKDTDVQLYDTCATAITDIPVSEWSFLIINKTEANSGIGDNSQNCEDIRRQVQEKNSAFADTVICNCSSPEETSIHVLDPSLKFLTNDIEKLDTHYIRSKQETLDTLRQQLTQLLEQAEHLSIFSATTHGNEQQLFDEKFDHIWQDLKLGFNKLKRDSREKTDNIDELFTDGIKKIIHDSSTDSGIPDEESIERLNAELGGWTGTLEDLMQKVRAHLSSKFIKLDTDLDIALESAKKRVSDLFKNVGKMDNISSEDGSQFLKALHKSCDIPNYDLEIIREALEVLDEFKLSFRGFLQHRIRAQLNVLDPDKSEYMSYIEDKMKIGDDRFKQLAHILKRAHEEAVENIEKELQAIANEPNQAIFGLLEEFFDRAFVADKAKNQWRAFFNLNRTEIWPEEFQRISEGTAMQEHWKYNVKQLKNYIDRPFWKMV